MFNLKSMILGILFLFCWTAIANPPAQKQASKKSQFSTQIYESEDNEIEFSARVKVVREVQGEYQVFFEGMQGFYSLQNETDQQKLIKSQETKKPVKVQVDPIARLIKKVEAKDD